MPAVPRSRYALFAALALGGCLADLLTKRLMFDWLGMPGGRTYWLWVDVLGFQTSLNPGALFGLGPGMWPLFATLSTLAAVAIVCYLFLFRAAVDGFLTVTLGLITGGILGNLFDRLALHGLKWPALGAGHMAGEPAHAVRDWILVMLGSYHWPNFNIADSMLVVGAGLLVLHGLWADSEPHKT